MTEPIIRLALDKSVRRIDQDGRLHVAVANISKANVCPYMGSEIPDAEALGLKPDAIYQLLRDPVELAKAAETFNNQPLLSIHRPHSAQDHNPDLVVGSTGTDAVFNDPYLQCSLVVWDPVAIAGIESNEQRELSCAYYYQADMTPGEFNGVRYDGVMRNIRANHVALVEAGRAGSDVMVGDSAPPKPPKEKPAMVAKSAVALSRKALLASGALRAYLQPKLAADAKLDLAPVLKTVTAKNWKASKPKIKAALDAAVKGKLAADADLEDVIELLDQLDDVTDEVADVIETADPANTDPVAEDDDAEMIARLREVLKAKGMSDEDVNAVVAALNPEVKADPAEPAAQDKDEPEAGKKPEITRAAMDAAIAAASAKAARDAERNTIARLRGIAEAERAVRPHIGELAVAQDSADAVYKLALDAADVDTVGVPPAAYSAMVKMLRKPSDAAASRPGVAMDAKSAADLSKLFPGASALKQR